MQDIQQTYVKMALDAWNGYVARTDKIFNSLDDEQIMAEVSPGRNRGIYLLGHLTAVNDGMLKILGLAERQHPELDAIFLDNPDKAGGEMPPLPTLRQYWADSNNKLKEHFSSMQPQDWFSRHMAVSEEDFKNEPHRNKLNVLMNRTNHLVSHYGQLLFLLGRQ